MYLLTEKTQRRGSYRQVASEVFKEKGYYRSTMDDIARRLGISKGANSNGIL